MASRATQSDEKASPLFMKNKIRSLLVPVCLAASLIYVGGCASGGAKSSGPKSLLVVTVTKGFRHSSIPTAEKVLQQLGEKSGVFTVDFVRNEAEMAEKMTAAALKKYDGIIFANTTGVLPLPDKQAFFDYIKAGHAFIGFHSASDTFHGPNNTVDPYAEMLGGEFQQHGAQVGVECLNQDLNHPATKHLGKSFQVSLEEIYIQKNYDPTKVHELLVLDKHPNTKAAGHFPIAWCKMYGSGKVFYTSLGHREDVWDPTWSADKPTSRKNSIEISEAYQKHILGGIKWALGLEKGDATP